MSAQELSVPPGDPSIKVRGAKPEDAPVCGRVCFDAFYKISTQHGFCPRFPVNRRICWHSLNDVFPSGFYCVVAESDRSIVGSNCLDERSAIAGLGAITVDPSIQNRGVGRKLMEAMLVRARERNFPGVRLLQSAFHNRSLALYSRLGFDAPEPLSVMQGPPLRKRIEGCSVRPARVSDVEDCQRICMQVHGHDRAGELADAMKDETAVVVERQERISGYATVLAFFGHAANIPASKVVLSIDEEPPYTIRLKGELKEQAFKLVNFVIATELSAEPGAQHFSIHDTLNNNGDYPKEYEALYHSNFGPPLLDPGAGFSAPVQQVSPFKERAVGEVADWQKYREPTRDYDETVFNVVPYGDENGETLAVLHNAAGDLGVSLGFNIQQFAGLLTMEKHRHYGAGICHGLGTRHQLGLQPQLSTCVEPRTYDWSQRAAPLRYHLHVSGR